jgi:hypothetical protein
MARRFSDEPINLIHRIPTPEQLASARPVKRSFSHAIVEKAMSYVRVATEVIARVTRIPRKAQSKVGLDNPSEASPDDSADGLATERCDPIIGADKESEGYSQPVATVTASASQERVSPAPSASIQSVVQPEEVAELRAFLLAQQQDIAHLSAQIQELKGLVISQQQVLVYLGKELEAGSLSPLTGSIAAGAPKRGRPVRQKPVMKDKAVSQKEDPKRSSLGLWPASTRRPDL